jgi:hypothetical protein
MDYTTSALVKTAIGTSATTDDTQIAKLVTAVSRAMDRKMAGAVKSDDYLKSESVSAEAGRGLVGSDGIIHYWARKPLVTAVSAFSYNYSPVEAALTVATSYIKIDGYQIMAYASAVRGRPFVTVSYTGGLSASQAALPEDVIEAATVLTVRYYKEVKGGLSDSIGVAELGTLIYTKAWPVRVLDLLTPYMRRQPIW